MGTIVLLAAFLLAASANPIANSLEGSIEDAQDTHTGDVSHTDEDSNLSDVDDTANDTEEHEISVGKSSDSTDGTGDADFGDVDAGDANTGGAVSSSVSAVSTTSTQGDDTANSEKEQHSSIGSNADSTEHTGENNEDNAASNAADDADSSSVTTVATTSTQVLSESNTTNGTNDVGTSLSNTHSTNSTQPETTTQQSTEENTTPGDADPKDCRNATETNHTYVLCTYSCQLDEMFVAPDNSSCYLHPPDLMTGMRFIKEYKPAEDNANETGVCRGGNCVPRSSETPAAPTVSSPAETSTQQSNETYTTPGDADPKDCRNATEPNHVYVLCTFSCQEDEMFTAPNNSLCYLYPKNMTADILITQEYDNTGHKSNKTGVCLDGQCVPRSTETSAAPTESSPGTTTAAAAETDGQTENPTRQQTSVINVKPNDGSEPFPAPSPSQETPTENIGSSANQKNGDLPEVQEASSPVTDGPEAVPETLPGIRN